DTRKIIEVVKRWIESNDQWLLVLDHVDDQRLIPKYIPNSYEGSVLLTTRRRVEARDITSRKVEALSREEGALFLLRRLEKLGLDQPLSAADPELKEKAERLSDLLGGLPLALEQAAAYINDFLDIDEYIEDYNTHKEKFLNNEIEDGLNEPDRHTSVSVTFQMSFEKVKEENPAAANLLQL